MPDDDQPTVPAVDVAAVEGPLESELPDEWATPPERERARVNPWLVVLAIVSSVVLAACVVLTVVHLPYYTIAPGDALDVNDRVTITGGSNYRSRGAFYLLFVRERPHINGWRWIQAKLDPEIDLVKEQAITGGQSSEVVEATDRFLMAAAQADAKKVAFEKLGKKVTADPGALVVEPVPDKPAEEFLRADDVIVSVDGKPIADTLALSRAISAHRRGDKVEIGYERKGAKRHAAIPVALDTDKHPIIGVFVLPRYRFPEQVAIDTSDIGGPSAGLAMTLAVLDRLSPGDLTGGDKVAVTGTIDSDGHVGLIGAIEQKAVAARRRGAQLFLVPACPARDSGCRSDLAAARKRAGSAEIVEVATIDDALAALRKAGGDALPK